MNPSQSPNPQQSPQKPKKASGSKFALIMGLFFFIGGLTMFYRQWQFDQQSTAISAAVIGNDYRPARGHSYYPIVSFTTKSGKKITATVNNTIANTGGFNDPVSKGTSLSVRYNNDNPSVVQRTSFTSSWGPALAALIIGGLILWLAIWTFTSAHKQNVAAKQKNSGTPPPIAP